MRVGDFNVKSEVAVLAGGSLFDIGNIGSGDSTNLGVLFTVVLTKNGISEGVVDTVQFALGIKGFDGNSAFHFRFAHMNCEVHVLRKLESRNLVFLNGLAHGIFVPNCLSGDLFVEGAVAIFSSSDVFSDKLEGSNVKIDEMDNSKLNRMISNSNEGASFTNVVRLGEGGEFISESQAVFKVVSNWVGHGIGRS